MQTNLNKEEFSSFKIAHQCLEELSWLRLKRYIKKITDFSQTQVCQSQSFGYGVVTYTIDQLISLLRTNPNSTIEQIRIRITFNYVPPKCISLYITNQGQYTPQSIYQLFCDFYNDKDEEI